jgi:predicted TIM-barrel fold metal-dependent hydrolase
VVSLVNQLPPGLRRKILEENAARLYGYNGDM